jgi:hypothetical protein
MKLQWSIPTVAALAMGYMVAPAQAVPIGGVATPGGHNAGVSIGIEQVHYRRYRHYRYYRYYGDPDFYYYRRHHRHHRHW